MAAGHHEHVGRVVYHLIERDQRKTPSHEFNDWPQPGHRRANSKTGKTVFTDRRVDDSSRSEAFEQTLAHLVGAVILRDFLAHEENIRVTLELLSERLVQRLAIRDLPHDFSPLE